MTTFVSLALAFSRLHRWYFSTNVSTKWFHLEPKTVTICKRKTFHKEPSLLQTPKRISINNKNIKDFKQLKTFFFLQKLKHIVKLVLNEVPNSRVAVTNRKQPWKKKHTNKMSTSISNQEHLYRLRFSSISSSWKRKQRCLQHRQANKTINKLFVCFLTAKSHIF